jgi:hypothetical protein
VAVSTGSASSEPSRTDRLLRLADRADRRRAPHLELAHAHLAPRPLRARYDLEHGELEVAALGGHRDRLERAVVGIEREVAEHDVGARHPDASSPLCTSASGLTPCSSANSGSGDDAVERFDLVGRKMALRP